MVCIECFVVPILFVIAAYCKQLFALVRSYFQPAASTSATSAPPPFNPSMINLAAHGLPPSVAPVDSDKLSGSVVEEKEGPASTPPAGEKHDAVAASERTIKRRK